MIHSKVLLLVALLSFFWNCEAKPVQDNFGFSPEETNVLLTGLLTNSTLRNNRDGTTTDPVTGLIWRTCAVGQVYRSTENDCQGDTSGSTLNPLDSLRYGARELAFCDSKTHACNRLDLPQFLVHQSVIAIGGVSQAFQACAGLGSPWRVASPLELKRLTETGRNSILANFPQTPEGDFWSGWSNEQDLVGETAYTISFDRQSFGVERRIAKTERNYVRCVRGSN